MTKSSGTILAGECRPGGRGAGTAPRKTLRWILTALALQVATSYAPAAVLIRDATVHTLSAAGTLEHTDILISDGKIAQMGHGLTAPANSEVIDAGGRPVTPG